MNNDSSATIMDGAKGNRAGGDENLDDLVFHPSVLSQIPLIIFFLFLCAISVYASRYPSATDTIHLDALGFHGLSFDIQLFAIFPISVLGVLLHRLYDHHYVIGAQHIAATKGKLSLRATTVRLDYDTIRAIELDQGVFDRLLNIGDLRIGSSAVNSTEVIMHGIGRPQAYADEIEARRKRTLDTQTADSKRLSSE